MDVLKNFTFFKINFKRTGLLIFRAVADPRNSGISTKSREIVQNPPEIQIHVGKTYLILILAIRPFLFTPNVQIYLETSSLQRVNIPKLPGVFLVNVAKNWALTIMLIALAFAHFSSELSLKEQMIIPVKKNVKQHWPYRHKIDRF